MGRLSTMATAVTAGLLFSALVWWALVGGVTDLYGGLADTLFQFVP
jgi:hypothetical protein